MSPEDYDVWLGKPTKDLNKKCKDNHKLLEGAVKKAGEMGEALGGSSTSYWALCWRGRARSEAT